MKPGSRAEFNFEQDIPDVARGHAESTPERPAAERPAGVLWIPDPEQPHGWREFYVHRPTRTTRTRMGFGPPRRS
jgi:hypothetical protein